MHYDGIVFKSVRDTDWSADHVAVHGVTLDEVREAILEHPYWAVPGRAGTILIYGRTYAGRYLLWPSRRARRHSSSPHAT